jgi:hypothetical protein
MARARPGIALMIERGDAQALQTGSAVIIPSPEVDRLRAALLS